MELPRRFSPAPNLPPPAWLMAGPAAWGGSLRAVRPARLLVVEDEYLVALEIEHRLEQAGFVVLGVAATAAEARLLAERERPEIVIMDIRLAGPRDGIEAAIELRKDLGIPSIFASAYVDLETRRRGELAHPLGWLEKPYSPYALVTLLNRVLDA